MGEVTASPRRGLLALFLGALCFFGLSAHGYVENTDAEITMHAARAWWLRGDPGLLRDGPDASAPERWIATQIHEPGPLDFGLVGRNGRAYVWFPIGHQALMVPAVALGEWCARVFPAAEARLFEQKNGDELFGRFFWSRFFVSWLPIPFAAGSVVLVFLLARALGASARAALITAAFATLTTALWPGSSETMSDVPGAFFLLACAAGVFAWRADVLASRPRPRTLLWAGVAGGLAVLVRYPHALAVIVLAVGAAVVAWRARRLSDLAYLALGGAPALVALCAANWLRFGSLTETGYSAGATPQWWSYPPWLGIPLILLAPGKGILWFSVGLWPALAQWCRRATWVHRWPLVVALAVLVLPIVVSGHTAGWAGGQCWSARYFTPGVVLIVAVGLALGRPWERRPRTLGAVFVLGALVSLGGVLTPYRGDRNLAHAATAAAYPKRAAEDVDLLPLIYDFEPRFSPIHSHWTYAWLSVRGRLAAGGSSNTTEPLFGVRVPPPLGDGLRPAHAEDIGLRHWWWRYGAAFFGWSPWLCLPLLLGAVAGLGTAWKKSAAETPKATGVASR